MITQISSPLEGMFLPPSRVYPEVIDENGNRLVIADRIPITSSTPLAFIDGNLRTAIIGGSIVNQYKINFPRELQKAIVEQRKELRLRIVGAQNFNGELGVNRLVAGGSTYSQPDLRVKLNVVYTKL